MTLRDVLLVLGAMPLLVVVALRLAAEMGLVVEAPPPEALTASLAAFGFVFLIYVALTLRSIARATTADPRPRGRRPAARRADRSREAAVSDFAIHLDRSAEIDLRAPPTADLDPDPDAEPEPAAAPAAPRKELFGEVSDLLTRIPSARSR